MMRNQQLVYTTAIFTMFLFLFPVIEARGQSTLYWENPVVFVPQTARFPSTAFSHSLSVVLWQESRSIDAQPGSGQKYPITLSMAVKSAGTNKATFSQAEWVIYRSVAGPYEYTGTEPAIASVAVDKNNRILIAAATGQNDIEVLISEDQGQSFEKIRVNGDVNPSLAPRIVCRADGGYLLFVTRGQEQSLSIFYSRSNDGKIWTDFQPLFSDSRLRLTFLPSHASLGSIDYVVFQALTGDLRPTFQIFLTSSTDGGSTWSQPKQITAFLDPYTTTRREPENFDNQRPFLAGYDDILYLAWERRQGNNNPQIYSLELQAPGIPRGDAERISPLGAYANNPKIAKVAGIPTVFWFDNRRGQNRVYMAQKKGFDWEDTDLSGATGEAIFANPVVDSSGLSVFWQGIRGGQNRLMLLAPDTTVSSPSLRPLNFTSGQRIRSDRAQISWIPPEDSSGILGYSYIWTQNPLEVPPQKVLLYSPANRTEQIASADGTWYFSLRAQDFAGNWSTPSTVSFVRDTTPPPAANLILPELDDAGFLTSNTVTFHWNPPPASDIAGYAWSLEYVAGLEMLGQLPLAEFQSRLALSSPSVVLPRRLMGSETQVNFTNIDNGVWRFIVSVVDTVGNISDPAVIYFRANKYIPYTIVRYIDTSIDDQGAVLLRILGRGFTEGGSISSIYIDRDGLPPYDRELSLTDGEYRIRSDQEIDDIRLQDLETGTYRIMMVHPLRGIYRTGPILQVDEVGTIKFGDFSQVWTPTWRREPPRRYTVDTVLLVVISVAILSIVGILIALRGISTVIAEGAVIRMNALALLSGEVLPMDEKKKKTKKLVRRGIGLGIKLALFTIVLVSMVVLMVSVPLTFMMTRTQEATLLQGLKDRSRVLLESLSSGARAYLPSQNVLELGFLPAQTSAVPEANYATITGFGSGATIFTDHVWATNDPGILEKIDTGEFLPGQSRLQDRISPRIETIARELDEQARREVGDISKTIAELTREALGLALKTDAESVRRRDDIQITTRNLESRLNSKLAELASTIGSEPEFPTARLPTAGTRTYIFFKPVLYRQGAEDVYFRGLIRLEVSIDSIYAQVDEGRKALIQVTALIALIALLIGVFGAILVSLYIVSPILKLVDHVKKIRDTEDKSTLEGQDIHIKSKDEIAVLGDTINEMTHGLVKAALASKDLTIGKEVQKKFIPLEVDTSGNKLTTGHLDARWAEFFGYYEGAKGVSGDYFDYINLDDRYFAVIKCDVAGKGVPAALIMIQVATLFINSFQHWRPTAESLQI
ncbi:MAG: HAMP domain-containing protein, partial [Termitinemataceae bacterium]